MSLLANLDRNTERGIALLSDPPANGHDPLRYCLLHPSDLAGLPVMRHLVKPLLPAAGLGAVYGPPACGKSFLALDLAAAVAEGADWFGFRTRKVPAAYVALEGESGLRQRLAAWQMAHGRSLPDGLRLMVQPFCLSELRDVADLALALQFEVPEGLVILDTLNRSAPAVDENTSQGMGLIVERLAELQRAFGGLMLAVHHTGKSAAAGLRGHSSLLAALDVAIEVTREGDVRAWRLEKAKDGSDGIERGFWLDVVEIGHDEDGDAVTSCTVRPDAATSPRRGVKPPSGANQRIAMRELHKLLTESTVFGKGDAPPTRPCAWMEDLLDMTEAALPNDSQGRDRRRETARRAITALLANGNAANSEGWLWLP